MYPVPTNQPEAGGAQFLDGWTIPMWHVMNRQAALISLPRCPHLPAPAGLADALPPELLSQQLLVPQPAAARLYTLLNVPTLSPATFLAAVALPHMAKLADGPRAMLLSHIQVCAPPHPTPPHPTIAIGGAVLPAWRCNAIRMQP